MREAKAKQMERKELSNIDKHALWWMKETLKEAIADYCSGDW